MFEIAGGILLAALFYFVGMMLIHLAYIVFIAAKYMFEDFFGINPGDSGGSWHDNADGGSEFY
jgi:hypothetical protein